MFLSKTLQLYLYWKISDNFFSSFYKQKATQETGSVDSSSLEPKMHLPFVHSNNNKKKIIIAKVPV